MLRNKQIYAHTTIVSAQAMASTLTTQMGATLTTRTLLKHNIKQLFVDNKVAPFQHYVALYLDSKEKLIDYSSTAQNNLLHKCQFEAKLVPETLRWLYTLADQFRRELQQPITRRQVTQTDPTDGRIELLERNKDELERLAKHAEKDIKQYKLRSICKALSTAMKLRWLSGGMSQQYQVQTKEVDGQLLAKSLAPYLPAPTPTRAQTTQKTPRRPNRPPPRSQRRPPRQSRNTRATPPKGQSNGTPATTQSTRNTAPKKIYTRVQRAVPVPSVPDDELGSRISHTKLKQ